MDIEVMKQAVIDALEDIKGFDITVLDVQKLTSMTTDMIVASANSSRQAKSLADNVREKLKELGVDIRGVEGEKEGEWVLVDLGDVVVHVMLPRVREFYALERLWTVGDEPPEGIDEYGDDHSDEQVDDGYLRDN